MSQRMYCRGAMWGVVVGLVVATLMIASCGKKDDPNKPVQVPYGATVLDALRLKTAITTRDTSFGKEVVGVGNRMATKNTANDDGFVVLVDGKNPGGALDQSYLHVSGAHTMEVRHVPSGKEGKDVVPFLVFQIDVR